MILIDCNELAQALELNPYYNEALLHYGLLLESQGESEEALKFFEQINKRPVP
jgi:tetratricopeptide (TPR) repeat protein